MKFNESGYMPSPFTSIRYTQFNKSFHSIYFISVPSYREATIHLIPFISCNFIKFIHYYNSKYIDAEEKDVSRNQIDVV